MASEANQSHELLKLEYEALTREILDYSGKVYQIVTLCSGGVAAILSYTLNADVSKFPLGASFFPFALLILPFLVLLPSILLVESSLRTTARLAGYIAVFHEEGREGLMWQRAIQAYREDSHAKKHRSFRRALIYVFSSLASGSLACSTFAVWGTPSLHATQKPFSVPFLCVFIAALVAIGIVYVLLIRRIKGVWSKRAFESEEATFRRLKRRLEERTEEATSS